LFFFATIKTSKFLISIFLIFFKGCFWKLAH